MGLELHHVELLLVGQHLVGLLKGAGRKEGGPIQEAAEDRDSNLQNSFNVLFIDARNRTETKMIKERSCLCLNDESGNNPVASQKQGRCSYSKTISQQRLSGQSFQVSAQRSLQVTEEVSASVYLGLSGAAVTRSSVY